MRTEGGGSFHEKAYCVDVVGTTGCGDVYHGAFLGAYVRGYKPEKAMEWASAAAAMKATRLGGRGYIPTSEEIERFISSVMPLADER